MQHGIVIGDPRKYTSSSSLAAGSNCDPHVRDERNRLKTSPAGSSLDLDQRAAVEPPRLRVGEAQFALVLLFHDLDTCATSAWPFGGHVARV